MYVRARRGTVGRAPSGPRPENNGQAAAAVPRPLPASRPEAGRARAIADRSAAGILTRRPMP